LPGDPGKSAGKSNQTKYFTALLVLRGSQGKSARFFRRIKELPRLLVLRSDKQDSAEMAEKISPHDAEHVLREIPRQLREGWREH
jgi:hypothetical protein